MRARVLKPVPQEGFAEEIYFRFHGRGCFFKYDGGEIDIDFGPKGRFDGFDMYRLKKFLKFREERFSGLVDEKVFEEQFNGLIEMNQIFKLSKYEDDSLYYYSGNESN